MVRPSPGAPGVPGRLRARVKGTVPPPLNAFRSSPASECRPSGLAVVTVAQVWDSGSKWRHSLIYTIQRNRAQAYRERQGPRVSVEKNERTVSPLRSGSSWPRPTVSDLGHAPYPPSTGTSTRERGPRFSRGVFHLSSRLGRSLFRPPSLNPTPSFLGSTRSVVGPKSSRSLTGDPTPTHTETSRSRQGRGGTHYPSFHYPLWGTSKKHLFH